MKIQSTLRRLGAQRGLVLLLAFLLTGVLLATVLAAPALAMEGTGEAGITPDPPAGETVVSVPTQPDPGTPGANGAGSAPSSSAPASSSSPSSDSSSSWASSSGNSSETSGETSSSGTGWGSEVSSGSKEPQEDDSSSASSRPGGNTSHAASSTPSYSNPDPKESYVEYIPPKTSGGTGHTTSAQNPIAIAPDDTNTQVLSSQNWDELLSMASSVDSEPQPASSLVPMGGIFGSKENTGGGGVSIVLILGIVLLALGTGGVIFFVYSQFFHKRRGEQPPEDFETEEWDYRSDDDAFGGYEPPASEPSSHRNSAPLNFEKTDRDISSFSDPSQKPANPLQPPPRQKPQVEDIDWDQFFKDNQ